MMIHSLQEALADPAAYARRYRHESGKKIIGTVCSYMPEELILAAGAHPMRLFGSNETFMLAGTHLQPYCCFLVRGIMEDGLSGKSDFLDGIVFPHTCDSMQRLSDIWRLNISFGFHLDVVWPVKLDTASARAYMLDVLAKFRADLEKALGVEISDEALKQSIRLTNTIRRALEEIYQSYRKHPGHGGARELFNLVRAAMIMDREAVAPLLLEEAARMKNVAAVPVPSPSKRLFLAGSVCHSASVYAVIEAAGGVVVGDDFCTGARYFEGRIDEAVDPLDGIAERLFSRPVCPAKHTGLDSRAERLLRLVRETDAEGVVFVLLKFCDPHAFDYPYLRQVFATAGIPVMLLETDDAQPPGGQLKTRLEAFLEML